MGRGGPRGFVAERQALLGGAQRGEHERAFLGRQSCAQQQRSVVVLAPADVAIGRAAGGDALDGDDTAVGAQDAFELLGGGVLGETEQFVLAFDAFDA